MLKLLFLAVSISLSFASFANQSKYRASPRAIALTQKYLLADGHIDVPYRLSEKWQDVTQATHSGDFDYPRAKQGGLNAPFMSIYVPAELDDSPKSTALAHRLIDSVEAIVGRAPDKFALAKTAAQAQENFKLGLISLPMGMENGSPIQGDLENLKAFYSRGIRYITLAHSQSNHIADSSYDLRRKWKGLSPFGKELVAEMNKLGVMVDISHVSDAAFYQAIEISKAPVIASHSSLRTFTPGFERNMDEDMLKALAQNGGIIMINFGSTFVDKVARVWRDKMAKKRESVEQEFGKDSQEFEAFEPAYRKTTPFPFANVDTVLDHIDRVVELIGVDYVGIGSDYDGVGDSLPEGLKDVSKYPNLVQGLLDRGYSETDIGKILGGNLLRVWRQVEKVAHDSQSVS